MERNNNNNEHNETLHLRALLFFLSHLLLKDNYISISKFRKRSTCNKFEHKEIQSPRRLTLAKMANAPMPNAYHQMIIAWLINYSIDQTFAAELRVARGLRVRVRMLRARVRGAQRPPSAAALHGVPPAQAPHRTGHRSRLPAERARHLGVWEGAPGLSRRCHHRVRVSSFLFFFRVSWTKLSCESIFFFSFSGSRGWHYHVRASSFFFFFRVSWTTSSRESHLSLSAFTFTLLWLLFLLAATC